MARFSTNNAFQNVRIPYSAFRKTEGASEDAPQRVRPEDIRQVGLLAEFRNRPSKQAEARDLDSLTDRSDREFKLEINRIHVSPPTPQRAPREPFTSVYWRLMPNALKSPAIESIKHVGSNLLSLWSQRYPSYSEQRSLFH